MESETVHAPGTGGSGESGVSLGRRAADITRAPVARTEHGIRLPGGVAVILPACLLFAAAYYQWPLFSSNQNTYFLSGLARAGYGYLSSDWLANQTDPIPVFSFVVYLIHAYGRDWMFHVLFGVLAAVFAASLSAIAARPRGMFGYAPQAAMFFVLLTLLYCPWLLDPLLDAIPGSTRIARGLERFSTLATNGVAQQHVIGPIVQPSMFGVLLVSSVACFIYGKELAAIFFAVLAGTVHPTYVLHAGVLTAAYIVVLVAERRTGRALVVGSLAALLILPIVLYVATAFRGGSPELLATGQSILIEERLQHHARASRWFSSDVYIQIAIVVAALVASFRSRRLFLVLILSAAVSAGLSIVQVVSGNTTLALLFPWRLSAWLIPACSAILLGAFAAGVARTIERSTTSRLSQQVRIATVWVSFAFLAVSAFAGVKRTIAPVPVEPHADLVSFLRATSGPGQTYLVPTDDQFFRLAVGLPICVDWKSHPYRDVEVSEWHDRLQLAYAFYESGNGIDAAAALASIQEHTPITHVVVARAHEHLLDSVQAELIFRGSTRVVAKLAGTSSLRREG